MSQPDPDAGVGRLLLEKLRLVLTLVVMDLKRMHGLVRLVVLMLVFVIVFSILIGFAGDIIEQVGTPSWTGDILSGDGPGGVEPLEAELESDAYIGYAPLTVNVTATVTGAEGDVSYKWYISEDTNGAEPVSKGAGTFTHTFPEPGWYPVTLEVADDRGSIDPQRTYVSVLEPMNTELQTIIVANVTEGESPLDVALSVHVLGGLGPYTYHWDFGDGGESDQRAPLHTFEADGEEEFRVSVVVTDRTGNMTPEQEIYVQVGEDEGGTLGFTLLDFAYGFCVLVCVVMVPVAFTAAYRKEMTRGTVRTLVCYPVGPLDITVAKLLYCFILCLPFTLIAFILPIQGLGKPGGDYTLIFAVTFLITVITMTIGAMASLAATRLTGRLWLRPHTVATGAVLLAYIGTNRMLGLMGTVMERVMGTDPDALVDTFGFLIDVSPYHLGGELLSAGLGGSTEASPVVLVLPILMLVVLGWLASRAYPSIYEKE